MIGLQTTSDIVCKECSIELDSSRVQLGLYTCIECSDTQKYSAHVVYPHKTGAFVQPVSKETKKNLQRLDRRAVKVGGKINAPQAREWKMPEPKPIPKPIKQESVTYNHQNFSDCFTGCKDTYIKYGYSKTINHIRRLYRQNKINLMTRTELTNFLASIHVMNRKERKQALNAFK